MLHVASRGQYAVFADAETFARTQAETGQEPEDKLPPQVRASRDRGDAFLIHAAEGDCEFSVALFVDEAPPPELAKAKVGAKVEGALLRLPSGRLALTAEEDVFTALDQLDLETWSSVDLAPGSYSLSAYDLTRWKAAERDRVVSANATPGDVRLNRIQNFSANLTLVFFFSNLFLALPALFLLAGWLGWMKALAWTLAVEVSFVAGLSILDSYLSRR
ncbi:MAG TPA: hypothetical protein VHU81_21090, partial [Thermoanaerobaculia bacterium]|nr:hypothetical protein [Thermoanaerobaculia bacterium]